MKIQHAGHASFIIETGGMRILTDPYDESVGYPVYRQQIDMVTISHDHYDHNAAHLLTGHFQLVKALEGVKDSRVHITGIASWHDDVQGEKRGSNIIYKIRAEKLDLVHLGDLGTVLIPEQVKEIGAVDVLFIPVGGCYTIDKHQAWEVIGQLQPKIIIPMHYKTPVMDFTIEPVEAFIMHCSAVAKKAELIVRKETLPEEQEVIVLEDIA